MRGANDTAKRPSPNLSPLRHYRAWDHPWRGEGLKHLALRPEGMLVSSSPRLVHALALPSVAGRG